MLWTTDEEIGSGTSRTIIEREARRASPRCSCSSRRLPGGALKTARKGCGEFELTITGVAAHAGVDPGKGASAIHELADQIAAIERLQDLDRGISVNVGVVSGGTPAERGGRGGARPDRRPCADDRGRRPGRGGAARAATAPARRASEYQRRFRAASAGTHASRRPALLAGARRGLLPRTRAARRDRPAAARTATSPRRWASRRSTVSAPIGDGAHAAHEHVEIAALPWRAALLAGLLGRLGSQRQSAFANRLVKSPARDRGPLATETC